MFLVPDSPLELAEQRAGRSGMKFPVPCSPLGLVERWVGVRGSAFLVPRWKLTERSVAVMERLPVDHAQ